MADVGGMYKVIGDTRIPVSRHTGALWGTRLRQAQALRKNEELEHAWDEAIKYYRNDQMSHRGDTGLPGVTYRNQQLTEEHSSTENVILPIVNILLPLLFAKNPDIELTSPKEDEGLQHQISVLERLLNALIHMNSTPGIGIKPRMRRAIVLAALTSGAWFKLTWVTKQASGEYALEELGKLSDALLKAKNPQELEHIEQAIAALETTVDFLQDEGPKLEVLRPHDVYVDPDAREHDLSDARWVIERSYVPTEYLKARYTKDVKGRALSLYSKKQVTLRETEADNNDPLKDLAIFEQQGYDDEESFRRSTRTEVFYVWDKTLRRVYLFAADNWDWPLWVWDDPYGLACFFPYTKLSFTDDPLRTETRGEIPYILDQQDEINDNATERFATRQWARRNIFYDSNAVSDKDVAKIINGPNSTTAQPLDIQGGKSVKDILFSIPPPSVEFAQFFDSNPQMQAIERITGIGSTLRGGEFRTNTTNRAIQHYQQVADTRIDDKIDRVTDSVGIVAWNLAQMCLQFMPAETVSSITGDDPASWVVRDPKRIKQDFGSLRVVIGSTAKPTTATKRQEALQIGQILGQFANAAPQAVTKVLLEVFSKAFDDVVITEADWEQLQQSVAQGDQLQQLEQMINSMDPQHKMQLAQAIAQGMPLKQAVATLMKQTQQGAPNGQRQPSRPVQ